MQLILSTAGRAPRCSELLVSHGEPLLRLQRFGETQFGLHELGSLDDVAMTDFSPMKMWIGRIRPAAKMPCSPFEQRPNLFRVIHKVRRSGFVLPAVGFKAALQGSMICLTPDLTTSHELKFKKKFDS